MNIKRLYQDCSFDVWHEMVGWDDDQHIYIDKPNRAWFFIVTIWSMIGYMVRVWSQPLRVAICRRRGHDWVSETDDLDLNNERGGLSMVSDCARCGLYHDDSNPF